jgi:glycerol-3-phosphate acyltransferase PlsY
MTRSRWSRVALTAVVGYLLGSIPSADLAARRATKGQVDLRRAGSHNPGALNAIDVLGRKWGYVVGVADVAKGAAAAGLGRSVAGDLGAHLGGTAAVIGHCYPVWSGFRGGKGVATACGQLVATFPAAVPVEVVAGGVGAVLPVRRPSRAITVLLAIAWVVTGVLWWRQRGPNLWGPTPSGALPLAAAASSAVVLMRFEHDAGA